MSTFTPKFESLEAIRKEVALICKQQNTVANRIQIAALSVLYHVHQHGDWTVALEFRNDITQTNGVNKQAMTDYLSAMMAASIDDESIVYDDGKSAADIDMEKCQAVQWYDFKKASAKAAAKTLGQLLEQFEKGAKKSIKAGKMTESERDAVVGTFEGLITEHVVEKAS